MNKEDIPLEKWIREKRAEVVPETSDDFSGRILDRLCSSRRPAFDRKTVWAFRAAAVLTAAAVGFARMELLSHIIAAAG